MFLTLFFGLKCALGGRTLLAYKPGHADDNLDSTLESLDCYVAHPIRDILFGERE